MKTPWWIWLFPVFGGLVSLLLSISGCGLANPEFKSVNYYNGTKVVTLEQGQKLVNVTFKAGTAWWLVRPMRDGEMPERYEFHEDSAFDAPHGQIIIQEKARAFP
jgi:hypothetical protein